MTNSVSKLLRRFHPSTLRHHPLLQDRISVVVLFVAIGINIATMLLLVLNVRHVGYPVPTHYVSVAGFDQTGGWYQVYRIGLFGCFVTAVNSFLAAKSFQRNRLASFFLLLGAAAVAVLCLVIGLAFAAIV